MNILEKHTPVLSIPFDEIARQHQLSQLMRQSEAVWYSPRCASPAGDDGIHGLPDDGLEYEEALRGVLLRYL